jgi:hypothetical protein
MAAYTNGHVYQRNVPVAMSLLRLIVLRRVLRFYHPLVNIVHGRDIFEYVLAILTAVGSQWLIGIIL